LTSDHCVRVIRVQNVTYLVTDIDAGIRFFVTDLGFGLRQDETFDSGWRRVVVGPPEGGTGFVRVVAGADAVRRYGHRSRTAALTGRVHAAWRSPIAGRACALPGGAITAFAQGANASGNCVGTIGYGVPGALAGWNPFVLDKNAGQCK
jgi:hypothetical protein